MPKFNEFLFGKKSKNKKLSTLTSDQEELQKLIQEGITSGEGPLKDIFGGFDMNAFKTGVSDPALKQFKEEVLPLLQEKFIAGNQVGGSGQANAFGKAGVDLQSKLAELLYKAQEQQKQNKIKGVETSLGTKAIENVHQPSTQGAVQGFIKGAGEGLGNAAGTSLAGGAGHAVYYLKVILAG